VSCVPISTSAVVQADKTELFIVFSDNSEGMSAFVKELAYIAVTRP